MITAGVSAPVISNNQRRIIMAKYQVGWTYTVWVEVEAENQEQAFDNALAIEYNFVDTNKSGATMELNEYNDPIIKKHN
jgi:hypothetical protein